MSATAALDLNDVTTPATPANTQADVVTPAAPAAKKRSRSKSEKKSGNGGTGVVVVGDRFVCSYSARVTTHAIFVPGIDNASFANIPCAFAWLEDCYIGTAEDSAKLKQAVCTDYEQAIGTVQRAPKREYLQDFGGSQYYDEWIGDLKFWDKLTEAKGSTTAEYKDRKKGTATKRGKGDAARVAFEAAMYSIAYNKGAGGCKQVNAIDGVAVEKGTKNVLTAAKAVRKLNTFVSTQQGEAADAPLKKLTFEGNGWIVIGLVPAPGIAVDLKYRNAIASSVTGCTVYGPAIGIFTKKHNQKIVEQ